MCVGGSATYTVEAEDSGGGCWLASEANRNVQDIRYRTVCSSSTRECPSFDKRTKCTAPPSYVWAAAMAVVEVGVATCL